MQQKRQFHFHIHNSVEIQTVCAFVSEANLRFNEYCYCVVTVYPFNPYILPLTPIPNYIPPPPPYTPNSLPSI